MERLTIKAVVLSLPLLLTSCSLFVEEVASPIVASDIYHSVNNTKPVTKSADSKQKKKEQEKLIQAGKCPVCGGYMTEKGNKYVCADKNCGHSENAE